MSVIGDGPVLVLALEEEELYLMDEALDEGEQLAAAAAAAVGLRHLPREGQPFIFVYFPHSSRVYLPYSIRPER
jgi:hypothetical protein